MVDGGDVWAIYRESMPVLAVSLAGSIFAGAVLGSEAMRENFQQYPGLLLLLPAFLATRGNVYGALGARVSSGLHQGLIEPRFDDDRRLVATVVASFVNGVGISVIVGVLAWAILAGLPGRQPASLAELVGITFLAGSLTSVVLIVGVLALVFAAFQRGLDPDNLVGPVVTTLGDVFGVVFLYAAVAAVGLVL